MKKNKMIQILVVGIIILFATGCSMDSDDEGEETTKLIAETGFKDYVWDMSPEKVMSMEYDDMTYISDTIDLEKNCSITYEYDDGSYVYDLWFEFQNNRIKEIQFSPRNVEPFEFYKFKKKQFDGKYGKVDDYIFPVEIKKAHYYVNTYQIELCYFGKDSLSGESVGITYTEYKI